MIEWQDPPKKRKREGKWQEIFDQLKENPGRWAKIKTAKDRNAHSLAGRLRTQFGSDYEIRSQLVESNDGVKIAGVWARYVPQDTPSSLNNLSGVSIEGDTPDGM